MSERLFPAPQTEPATFAVLRQAAETITDPNEREAFATALQAGVSLKRLGPVLVEQLGRESSAQLVSGIHNLASPDNSNGYFPKVIKRAERLARHIARQTSKATEERRLQSVFNTNQTGVPRATRLKNKWGW